MGNMLAETIELGVGESSLGTVLVTRSAFYPEHYQMPDACIKVCRLTSLEG
jgi:hypothetical protein